MEGSRMIFGGSEVDQNKNAVDGLSLGLQIGITWEV